MRILHTADWHIGLTLNGWGRESEHAALFARLTELVRDNDVDAMVVSGERFLVSLALALALSGLGGKQSFADTLFIDEGFGSLDAESLDIAIDALETLQSPGRNVGVISHVEAMKDRVPVQIRVVSQGGGRSVVSVVGPQRLAA